MTVLLIVALLGAWAVLLAALVAEAGRERDAGLDLLLGDAAYLHDHRDDADAIGNSTGLGDPTRGGGRG